jgi:hypothetical protein
VQALRSQLHRNLDCKVLNPIKTDRFLEMKKLVFGEKIAEEKGKIVGFSVKSVGPEGVHIEENFASEVKGLGRFPSGRDMGTLNIVLRSGGVFSGTGQGTKTTQDGDSAVWKCYLIGKPEEGKHKCVIIIEFMTASQKLSWMNGLIAIEDAILDPITRELSGTAYEWK